jgi:hypothetical protein
MPLDPKYRLQDEFQALGVVAAIRWHVCNIERLALSIFAKHPKICGDDVTEEAMAAFRTCATTLARLAARRFPTDPCSNDDECVAGFHCDPVEGICKASPIETAVESASPAKPDKKC